LPLMIECMAHQQSIGFANLRLVKKSDYHVTKDQQDIYRHIGIQNIIEAIVNLRILRNSDGSRNIQESETITSCFIIR
jgi:hypothetical protein